MLSRVFRGRLLGASRSAGACAARLFSAVGEAGADAPPPALDEAKERMASGPLGERRPAERRYVSGAARRAKDGARPPRVDPAVDRSRPAGDQPRVPLEAHAPSQAPKQERRFPATPEQLALNGEIVRCASTGAVLDVVTANLALANGTNLSTALHRISVLPDAAEAKHDARLGGLLDASLARLSEMDSRGLSTVVNACCKLELQPPPEWLAAFWQISAPRLAHLEAQGFANMLYACARLELQPPAEWLEAYWRESAAKLQTFSPLALSSVMYAAGVLSHKVPASWMRSFWDVSLAALPEFSLRGLTNTLHGAAELQCTPPQVWLAQYWQLTDALAAQSQPREFSDIVHSCHLLHIEPPPEWLERCWALSSPAPPDFPVPNLARTLIAVGHMGLKPSDAWMLEFWNAARGFIPAGLEAAAFSNAQHKPHLAMLFACGQLRVAIPDAFWARFWPASEAALERYDAENLSGVLGACRSARTTPPSSWLSRYFQVSAPRLVEFSPPHTLGRALDSCAELQLVPPDDWMQLFWDAAAAALPALSLDELSSMLRAVMRLGVTPPEAWLQSFWSCSAQQLTSSWTPLGFAYLLYAAAKTELNRPPEHWMSDCWAASREKLVTLPAKELSLSLWAAAKLHPAPPDAWMQAYWTASSSQLSEFSAQGCANVMYSLGWLGRAPPEWWLRKFWHASAQVLPECKPQELTNLLNGCADLSIMPPRSWEPQFWDAFHQAFDRANMMDFSGTLHACAALRLSPPDAWMARFWDTSVPMLGSMDSTALAQLLRCCVKLACKPPDAWVQHWGRAFGAVLPPVAAGKSLNDVSDVLFAVCVFELWDMPHLDVIWRRLLAAAASFDDPNVPDARFALCQMRQIYQFAATQRPGLLAAPSAALLELSRASWSELVHQSKTDHSDSSIPKHLQRIGVAFTDAHFCERSERIINFAFTEGVAQPIALEVLTSARLLRDGRPDGRALLRRRVLEAHGWRVVELDARPWLHLETDEERDAHLRELLGLAPADRE